MTGGLRTAPAPLWLGAAPEHRHDVTIVPALAVPLADGTTALIGGRTGLLARAATDGSRVVLSFLRSTNQNNFERDLVAPFFTHLALAALGDDEQPTRAIVLRQKKTEPPARNRDCCVPSARPPRAPISGSWRPSFCATSTPIFSLARGSSTGRRTPARTKHPASAIRSCFSATTTGPTSSPITGPSPARRIIPCLPRISPPRPSRAASACSFRSRRPRRRSRQRRRRERRGDGPLPDPRRAGAHPPPPLGRHRGLGRHREDVPHRASGGRSAGPRGGEPRGDVGRDVHRSRGHRAPPPRPGVDPEGPDGRLFPSADLSRSVVVDRRQRPAASGRRGARPRRGADLYHPCLLPARADRAGVRQRPPPYPTGRREPRRIRRFVRRGVAPAPGARSRPRALPRGVPGAG